MKTVKQESIQVPFSCFPAMGKNDLQTWQHEDFHLQSPFLCGKGKTVSLFYLHRGKTLCKFKKNPRICCPFFPTSNARQGGRNLEPEPEDGARLCPDHVLARKPVAASPPTPACTRTPRSRWHFSLFTAETPHAE